MTPSDLSASAMIVSLRIRRWNSTKTEKSVADEIAAQYKSDPTFSIYTKRLVARDAVTEVQGAMLAARKFFNENTLPWFDAGKRILPSAHYFDFMSGLNRCQENFDRAVARFIANYEEIVAEAEKRLGGVLFNQMDYPSPDKIDEFFEFTSVVEPLPTGRDFRITLGAEHEARIKQELEDRLRDGQKIAMNELWSRIHDVAEHMAERLRLYTVEEVDLEERKGGVKRTHPFRETLISNVMDLVNVLPALNVEADEDLSRMTDLLRDKLSLITAEDLRDDEVLREDTIAVADEVVKVANARMAA